MRQQAYGKILGAQAWGSDDAKRITCYWEQGQATMTLSRYTVPTVVLMAGLPGAGKTTLALALGRTLGWPMLDKDTLKSALLNGGVGEQIAAPLAYELLWTLGRDLAVSQQLSVILDSPARFPHMLAAATEIADDAGGQLKVVVCLAPQRLRNQRLAQRTNRASQPAFDASTDEQAQRWYQALPSHALRVDTTRPLDEYIAGVLAYLRA